MRALSLIDIRYLIKFMGVHVLLAMLYIETRMIWQVCVKKILIQKNLFHKHSTSTFKEHGIIF